MFNRNKKFKTSPAKFKKWATKEEEESDSDEDAMEDDVSDEELAEFQGLLKELLEACRKLSGLLSSTILLKTPTQ